MSRIYCDSMLFIYWIESHPEYGRTVDRLFQKFLARQDEICTSVLTIGEVLVQPIRQHHTALQQTVERFFATSLVTVLPIDRPVIERFAHIRAQTRIAPVDALHLACAAVHDCSLFITNDKGLHRQQITGLRIDLIAALDLNLL